MRVLSDKQDPTGFLNLFRLASMDRFGDPSGHIQGRGRWEHGRKKGPGRRAKAGTVRGEMRSSAVERNPFMVVDVTARECVQQRVKPPSHAMEFEDGRIVWVTQGPVRMKLPRLRRCSR
jgi:hypothetical protein